MKQTRLTNRSWTTAALILVGMGATVSPGQAAPNPSFPDHAPTQRHESARTVQFSGYEWTVKSSAGPVGPGPNVFSNSSDNVWVDSQGRLHLRITRQNGQFQCAEVICTQSLGYGSYRFYCDTPAAQVDQNAVLGLFTWKDEPSFAHRELDIEISRWGKANNQNAQFVVQPYTAPDHIFRFELPADLPQSVQSFDWQPKRVSFRSVQGHAADPAKSSDIVAEKTFTHEIPEPGGENLRVNLWLFRGQPPANASGCEIVISRFEFTPTTR